MNNSHSLKRSQAGEGIAIESGIRSFCSGDKNMAEAEDFLDRPSRQISQTRGRCDKDSRPLVGVMAILCFRKMMGGTALIVASLYILYHLLKEPMPSFSL